VPLSFKVLRGQPTLEPVHFESFSQPPEAVAQVAVLGNKVGAGHVTAVPVQYMSF
jgi:hypothetical protein